MTALPKKIPDEERIYTIEDIYSLPEGKHAELIDGVIYDMGSPSTQHQRILSALHATIFNYLQKKKGPCEAFPAPFAVFLNKDKKTYLEPDITVICDPDKIDEKGCKGVPDWIVEIVSPSTGIQDTVRKLWLYAHAGVREYWIVEPSENVITVHNFIPPAPVRLYRFSDVVPVGIYEGFSIDFSQIRL